MPGTKDGDRQDASFGGVAPISGEGGQPRRVPYLHTQDAVATAAAATANGGPVLTTAADVPEAGRIARLADPFGAALAPPRPGPQM